MLQGAVTGLCWAVLPGAAAGEAALHLYSLSADGALLAWGPLPLTLGDLFGAGRGGRAPGSASPAASPLSRPVDLAAQLSAAGALEAAGDAEGGLGDLPSWRSSPRQQTITAFTVQLPGGPAADALAGAGGHLLAVASQGGRAAVLAAGAPTAPGCPPELRLLWAAAGAPGAAAIRCAAARPQGQLWLRCLHVSIYATPCCQAASARFPLAALQPPLLLPGWLAAGRR